MIETVFIQIFHCIETETSKDEHVYILTRGVDSFNSSIYISASSGRIFRGTLNPGTTENSGLKLGVKS